MPSQRKIFFKTHKSNVLDIDRMWHRARYNLYVSSFYGSCLVVIVNLIGISYYKYVFLHSNKGFFSALLLGLVIFTVFMVAFGFIQTSLTRNAQYYNLTSLLRTLTSDNPDFIKLQHELEKKCDEIEGVMDSKYLKFYVTKNYLIYTDLGLSQLVIIPFENIETVRSKYEYSFFEGYFWRILVRYEGVDGYMHHDKIIIPTWIEGNSKVLLLFGIV